MDEERSPEPQQAEAAEPQPSQPVAPPPQQAWSASPGYGAQQQPEGAFDRIIPAKNPPALIAYYLGVFSLVPCFGLFLGPAAIILGLRGLKAVKQNPALPGKGHAWTGVIIGSITTVLFWGVTVMIAIAAATQK